MYHRIFFLKSGLMLKNIGSFKSFKKNNKMKKKEIFDWALKIIGVLVFIYSIGSIKEFILFNLLSETNNHNQDLLILILFVFLVLQWSIAALLTFRTRILTNLLFKKEYDTTETPITSLNSIQLFKLGFILVGLSILVFSLPNFIVDLFKYISSVQKELVNNKFELTNIFIVGLRLVFSVVLIINSTRLSHYFSKAEIMHTS